MNQIFLPMMSPDSRIVNILAITNTAFTGSETSFTQGGSTWPLAKYSQPLTSGDYEWQNRPTVTYMYIPVSRLEAETLPDNTMSQYANYSSWFMGQGFAQNIQRTNSIMKMLSGSKFDLTVTPVVTPSPTAANATMTIEWGIQASETSLFTEFNWVSVLQASSGNSQAASLTIGAISTDPSHGMVRMFVVSDGSQIINGSILMNTIRIVKITSEPLPSGSYVWPATVTNTDGGTVAVTITMNVA